MLREKTSLVFPASHARHILTLLVLDSSLRSEDKLENAGSLENADSAKKIRYPGAPMGRNPRWRRRQEG